jgi:non-ribosomal peptide synthetase component F
MGYPDHNVHTQRCNAPNTLHAALFVTLLQAITGHVTAPFEHITMGHPDHNVHTYVVVVDEEASPTDERHSGTPKARLAAVGEPGELWLSGPRLARGYRNRPDLTAKAFVPNPFFAAATASLPADADFLRPHYRLAYRTGDLVQQNKDGTIDFLGRVDRQVKVNGVRMEVGEIENVLAGAPGEACAQHWLLPLAAVGTITGGHFAGHSTSCA